MKKVQQTDSKSEPEAVHTKLDKNAQHIKQLFSYGLNKDFTFRELTAKYSQEKIEIYYYSSIVDANKVYDAIVRPLLESEGKQIRDVIVAESVKEITDFEQATEHINSGKAIIFEDGNNTAYSIDVAKFEYRGIGKAENESTIRGPQEAFTESLNVNVSLIRKRMHDKQLVTEGKQVGARSKSEVNIVYVKDLVNEEILKSVRERLDNIEADNVRNLELLEQFIEERPYSLVPTVLFTERPGNATSYLEDGHIIILMNNSAGCLIVPVTFWSFFHSPEDRYLRFLFGNFSRLVRMLAFYLTTMISATYIAITNFHSAMLPPDLLLAITASRERVPFPLIFEILIMEIAFELIREAGIRIPNPLGPTIGIVGALILGQAAVQANIISPIIVIITAVSGLTSFAVTDVSINYSVRITRFIFIFSAGFLGIFSLMGAFLAWFMYVASIKSFGVPFFAPLSPSYRSPHDTLFRKAIRNEIWRPGQIKPKDIRKKANSK
ncbi:spore germination protein [Aquibacillus kalidii]|uniref:spore germination protein n=1 Tax=Aquibacillus kalidii TaxID=2762597 RepID=UPI001644C945|nr:spore germination protein [Aquibacillus kalidii]